MELFFFQSLHQQTERDFLSRMNDDKVHCMQIARQYGQDFFDGHRRYGFGGYRYDGRWRPFANKLIEYYQLKPDSKILEVGCGKGYLLYEFTQLLPECQVVGLDISTYAIENSKPELKGSLLVHDAANPLPFPSQAFDFAFSIATLHNLPIPDLKTALQEFNRVAQHKYLCVEAYRNIQELFALQCWALTAESFFSQSEWIWLYKEFNYTGDYEFMYF